MEWYRKGKYLEVLDRKIEVFYVELGDSSAEASKTVMLLHGFPESSFSFHKVVEGLAQIFDRVVLVDLPGFGHSAKPKDYLYSIANQSDALLSAWSQLGVKGGHIIAHDMGDSIATELLHRFNHSQLPRDFDAGLQSIALTNGGVILEHSQLRWTQKVLLSPLGNIFRFTANYRLFSQQVRSAHGNENLGESDIRDLWKNHKNNGGRAVLHRLIYYLKDRETYESSRWLPALREAKIPIHIVWGLDDNVAPRIIQEQLISVVCPSAFSTKMLGVGHFCQLGSPSKWTDSIKTFYESI